MLRAHHVEHGSRIDSRGHSEADARGKIRFYQAGDDVNAGALRGQHEVHADGARHLREASNALFHIRPFEHHQVGQFVDQNQNVRDLFELLDFRFILEQASRLGLDLAHFLVVLIDVTDALRRQQFQSPLHFEHRVAERVGRLLRICNHGRQ